MGEYTVSGSRLLPLHNVDDTAVTPHATIQSITMGVRFGDQKYAIGYIHAFSFEMKRDAKSIWQIEPYMGKLGDDTTAAAGVSSTFSDTIFDEQTTYFPGEAVEVIPGKMSPIDIKISRYSLYTGNLLAATLRSSAAGVYDTVDSPPNIATTADAAIKYVNILQQVRPFDIYQIFVSPVTGGVLWGRKFGRCWFTNLGEKTPESDKNEAILEDATVQATYIRPLTSSIGKTSA